MSILKLFILVTFTSLFSCNDNSSQKTGNDFVDTSHSNDGNINVDSVMVEEFQLQPNDICGSWFVELRHIKNSCKNQNGEGFSSQRWNIWQANGNIKVAEIKSQLGGIINDGVLKNNVLEIYNEYENIVSNETIVLHGKLEFSDANHFLGFVKEIEADKCVTTYTISGSK
jgi:hypothetical protein